MRRHCGCRTTQKRRAELHTARPDGKGGSDPSSVGDAARRKDRYPHGVCDLRHQSHCADHVGSGAVAKAAAATSGFEPCAMMTSAPFASSERASATVVVKLKMTQPASLIRWTAAAEGRPK
jgi:hypothetical protein